MSRIGLNITVTGLTGSLLIRWVKASAPLAEVGRSAAFAFPYDAVYTINNLERVVYIVQLWRSDDGVALSQLIKDWSIDASVLNTVTLHTYQYVVDRGWNNTTPVNTGPEVWADPVDLDTVLVDERLDGAAKEDLLVHEAGYGNRLDSEYDLVAGGGIELLMGKTFDSGVAWFITVSTVETVSVGGGGSGGGGTQFEGVEIVDADRDFYVDATDNLYNKLVIADADASVLAITFPDLSLIPDHTHVTFNTHGGAQKYLKLQFDPGDTVRYLGQLVNVIYVARSQKISLYFFEGACYVTDEPKNGLNRGKIVADYDTARGADTGAYLAADEATGELLEADYPGLYEFIAALPSGSVPLGTAVGQWSYDSGGGVYPNKRFYGIKTTDPKAFRVPHLSGVSVKFGATPGTYEPDNVGSFSGNISIQHATNPYSGLPNVPRVANAGENNIAMVATPFTYVGAIADTRVRSVLQTPYIVL